MFKVCCSVEERFVNPLFEVFDGGDFILSSYHDIESCETEMQIFFPEAGRVDEAKAALSSALEIVGAGAEVSEVEVPDEDWRFSYRRHFKTERIGKRLVIHPPWEPMPPDGVVITLDPGLSFGTGKHETTRACLEYIDYLSEVGGSMLDMGCGSGILSIAAAKLGFSPVAGFDVDEDAVGASRENAELNGVVVDYVNFALGGATTDENGMDFSNAWPVASAKSEKSKAHFAENAPYDLVVANILGPLLIGFAEEIMQYVGKYLVISGILNEIHAEVLAAYTSRGLREVSRKTFGEWTTSLLSR